jgi:hypothetical protein
VRAEASVLLFGSSVSRLCEQHSDLDLCMALPFPAPGSGSSIPLTTRRPAALGGAAGGGVPGASPAFGAGAAPMSSPGLTPLTGSKAGGDELLASPALGSAAVPTASAAGAAADDSKHAKEPDGAQKPAAKSAPDQSPLLTAGAGAEGESGELYIDAPAIVERLAKALEKGQSRTLAAPRLYAVG